MSVARKAGSRIQGEAARRTDSDDAAARSASRSKINLITGMDRTFQQGTDVHAQCASCYLSSAEPYTIKESAWPLDRTLDHLVADKIGTDDALSARWSSVATATRTTRNRSTSTISPGTAPATSRRRFAIRARCIGGFFPPQENDRYRDVTDLVLEDARSMQRDLGYSDGQKFAEYFDSIRTIETQMDRLEKMKSELAQVQLRRTARSLPAARRIHPPDGRSHGRCPADRTDECRHVHGRPGALGHAVYVRGTFRQAAQPSPDVAQPDEDDRRPAQGRPLPHGAVRLPC